MVNHPTSYIYIHGFNSSPDSLKARLLQAEFARRGIADRLLIPKLPHWPKQAIELLAEQVAQRSTVTLIGSSLGGFYATWLTEHYSQARAVLVNPAVAPQHLLRRMLGENANYYSDERYELTCEHLDQLVELYLPELKHPQRLLLLQQQGDETLDYRDAVHYYRDCQQIVQPGGNHGFENFDTMFATIFEFAERELDPGSVR